jgi:hypothetical protein
MSARSSVRNERRPKTHAHPRLGELTIEQLRAFAKAERPAFDLMLRAMKAIAKAAK